MSAALPLLPACRCRPTGNLLSAAGRQRFCPGRSALQTTLALAFSLRRGGVLNLACCHIHDVLGELVGVTGPSRSRHALNMAHPGPKG